MPECVTSKADCCSLIAFSNTMSNIFIGGVILGAYVTKNEIRKEQSKDYIKKLEDEANNKTETES